MVGDAQQKVQQLTDEESVAPIIAGDAVDPDVRLQGKACSMGVTLCLHYLPTLSVQSPDMAVDTATLLVCCNGCGSTQGRLFAQSVCCHAFLL